MRGLLSQLSLYSVCESAHCPNLGECFSQGTATFLLMGNICTRHCRFCAVGKGEPLQIDQSEPGNIAQAVNGLNLKHVVLTSVTRDDLPDGGAGHFVGTITAIRKVNPRTTIEVLIPDFLGFHDAIRKVVESGPEVINHNVETVPRLYPAVRPEADYYRSIDVLKRVKYLDKKAWTKSGLMLGLGEYQDEVVAVMEDLRAVDCNILTLGQYLAPSFSHFPVKKYISPEEFEKYKTMGLEMGFNFIASGPFVRSSYQAAQMMPLSRSRASMG